MDSSIEMVSVMEATRKNHPSVAFIPLMSDANSIIIFDSKLANV
jgi:hypothetical protein